MSEFTRLYPTTLYLYVIYPWVSSQENPSFMICYQVRLNQACLATNTILARLLKFYTLQCSVVDSSSAVASTVFVCVCVGSMFCGVVSNLGKIKKNSVFG